MNWYERLDAEHILPWFKAAAIWLVGTVGGGLLGLVVGDQLVGAGLAKFAPGYFQAKNPWLLEIVGTEHFPDYANKFGRGDIAGQLAVTGVGTAAVVLGWLLWAQQGRFMTILRALLIVAVMTCLGALAGGLLGYVMGTTNPGYYRGVFRAGGESWFDPVQVGIGLGVSQGTIVGTVVGSVVVLAVSIYRARVDTNRQ